ncbi:hypothetical protein EDC04DRAFT_2899110 [Pisolithus marmoratus]|nr:hypothetical protein EDC04DRAFT_2899110 [Pisolithus marmoratus]
MSHLGQDDDCSDDDFDLDSVGQDSDDNDSDDLDEMRRGLQVPGPSTEAHELHNALAVAQKVYVDAHTELHSIWKELTALSSAIPAHTRNHVLNKTETLNSSITKEAKKYLILYHFWVADSVFPTTLKLDVDPCSPSRWDSPRAKMEGMTAELYSVILESLHKSMEQHPCFDAASLIFAQYNLNLSMLSTQHACKQMDPKFRTLLTKNNEYTQLAPILFKNHEVLVPDEFLKSPIIVLIIHILISGKSSLSNQKQGWPKAREGLIAGAATLACFLLSADLELGAVGVVMGIPYHDDFDFYLQRLFKCMNWAIDVMDSINQEVFSVKLKLTSNNLPDTVSDPALCTWEDDFLDKMENGMTTSASVPPTNAMNIPPPHSPPPLSSLPPSPPSPISDEMGANMSTSGSSTQENSITMSAISRLQVEVSQLSVSNAHGALPKSALASANHVSTSQRISLLPAQPAESTSASLVQPEPAKQRTCGCPAKLKAK